MTAREVLQYVGTDVFRKMQHNVWADATVRLIEKENPTLALIADCRFPNEVEAIKNAGGIIIKLNRDTESDDEDEWGENEIEGDESNSRYWYGRSGYSFDEFVNSTEELQVIKASIIK